MCDRKPQSSRHGKAAKPQRIESGAVPDRVAFFTAKLGTLWNSGAHEALWTGMKTRGGDGAGAPASKMIDQRHPDTRRKSDPSLDEARLRQQAIGVKLRQMFDQVVNEPVPDEFLSILKRADQQAGED
jgi:hypothetical protein